MSANNLDPNDRHVLSLIVDNEAGVLMRVVGMFSGRGYNIHSLTVSEIDSARNLSRITIATYAPDRVINLMISLLERLIPVHEAKVLSRGATFVERGLILLKVSAPKEKREEVLELAHRFHAQEVDSSPDSFIFELSDITAKLDEFIALMQPYGIIELARTGITALTRGTEVS